MIDVIKESSLTAALSAAPLTALPKIWDGTDKDGYWIRAICLVLKRDASQSYTLALRDARGKVRQVRDFGHIGAISRVLSVYPYDYLDEQQYCTYGNPRLISRTLRMWFGEKKAEEIMGLDEQERYVYLREIGINKQLDAEREGTFISSEEKEARRKEKEAADKAAREALAEAKNVARVDGDYKAFSFDVVSSDDDKAKTALDKAAKKVRKPRKTTK